MKVKLSPISSQSSFFTPAENRKQEVVRCFQEVQIGNTGFKCVKVKFIVEYIKQRFFSAKLFETLPIVLIL